MKNFFKKLAFVLSLAMVVTLAAPAAKASAATAPTLKTAGKVLYIDGDVSGKYGDNYRFYFNNAAGYTASWKALNPEVATVVDKRVYAVAPGRAEFEVTLTNKAGNTVVLNPYVVVKQNAEKVGFGAQTAIENAVPVGESFKINVYRQVGATKVWSQTDFTTCTDKIVWSSSNEDLATVDKWGRVTTKAAGEVTITAKAVQAQKNLTSVEASYTFTVAAGITAAKQTNLTTAQLSFAKEMTDAEMAKVKVYQLVGSTKVLQSVKSAKVDSDNKNLGNVELYVELAAGKTYVYEYGDSQKEIVAVDASKAENVTGIAITATEAVKGVAKDLGIKLYVGDVDVTTKWASRVTVSSDATNAYLDPTNKAITLFATGNSANVKAVYHTYKYENNQEVQLETTGTVVCVDAATVTYKETTKWSLYTGDSFDFDNGTVKTQIPAGESMKLAVKIKKTDDTYATSGFKFTSSDNTVLLVNNDIVSAVKDGSAVIIVSYNDTVIDALPIVVIGKRAVADVDVSLSKTNLSKQAGAGDSLTITVTLKDQLGEKIQKDVTIAPTDPVVGPNPIPSNVKSEGGVTTIKFETSDFSSYAETTYQYKITIDGNQYRFVNFSVANADSVNSTSIVLSSTAVDTALKANADKTDAKDISIKLESVASNGYKVKNESIENGLATASSKAIEATGTAFYYVTLDGPDGNISVDAAKHYTAVDKFEPVIVSGGTIVVKAKAGTYKVTAYKVICDNDDNKVDVTAFDVKFFTITDTQAAGTVEYKSNASADVSHTALGAVKAGDFVVLKYNDKAIAKENIMSVKVAGTEASGNTVFIYSATCSVPLNYDGNTNAKVDITIDINQYITLK